MTKEVEDIIRFKSWEELTIKERELLNEWADNAEDYGQMRWFLTETNTAFKKEKITASPELRKGVMAQFEQNDRKPVIWLNTLGTFLLPEDKKVYQKPGFQLGIAAVLVLGFLWTFQMDWNEPEIAQNIPNEINVPTVNNTDESKMDEISSDQEEKEVLDDNKQDLGQIVEGQEQLMSEFLVDEKSNENLDQTLLIEEATEADEEVEELSAPADDRMFLAEDIDMEDAVGMVEDVEKDKIARERKEMEAPGTEDEVVVSADNARADKINDVTRSKSQKMGKGVFSKKESTSAMVSEPLAVSEEVEAAEEIMPKSLHIDQTKELKSLFFTVK